ncbi:MAG: hypothetical protein ACJ74Y_14070 [Bryobacteraceae bacterium]|jgi:hypothetical protein
MADAKRSYLSARVEDATTVGDSYRHYEDNPTVFVAGVQYALDMMLQGLTEVTVNSTLQVEYAIAQEILNRAKRGTPR